MIALKNKGISMFHKLHDDRIICTSIMTAMPIKRYIELVSRVYENKGGLPNQRAPLKTKTAMTIRKRMVLDIHNGAVGHSWSRLY